jgi:class 3 adenylate cyclase/tetratricopeptide (TPR) repeat protein
MVEPELRRVTVLVADIEGSTALIQDLDAEDAADLIDPALRTMIDAAERFDGAVSHRGDGIMVVFGAPTVAEDHALRACLAALAMRDTMAAETSGVKLRVGIHSGPVVFRPVRINGAMVQDAVGIAVHIAARLEQSAAAGMICLSDSVLALAGNYLRTAPLQSIQVKGIEAPMARHRLEGADPSASRWAVRAARGLSTFVGRQAEVAILADSLDGHALRSVQIVGPAGMGKSRLIHEFLQSARTRDCHTIVWAGDHLRHFAPFQPITSWLRAWLGIRDADTREDARGKLIAGLFAVGHPVAAETELLERLLGIGEGAQPLKRIDYGGAIAALLEAQAQGRQLVLVCEDADRFDPAVMELLESALPKLAKAGPLVVSASRARVRFAGIPPANVRMVPLGPLSEDEASTMLATMEQGRTSVPGRAADILDKAGGNPLFIEEVAPLVAHGFGETDAGLPEIPDRVDELIADRLGRLPIELRGLVQLCAVIGPDVPLRVLAPLSGLDEATLATALDRLADEQLLYESRRYPDPQVTFKHALTREVAYRTILTARRKTQHERIVDILAGGDAVAITRYIDELCHHALKAQRWAQAVEFLRIAAREAMARTAFQAALVSLKKARDAGAKLPDSGQLRLEVLSELHQLVRICGSYADLGAVLDEAQELAEELDDRPRITELLATRVHLFNILGRLDEAIALGERTRIAARAHDNSALLLTASFFAGQSYFNAGRLLDAERVLTETLATVDALEAAGSTESTLVVHRNLSLGTRAMARVMQGDHVAAMADIDAARPHAVASPRPYDRIFIAAAAGFVAAERRDPEAAGASFHIALELAGASGISQLRPPVLAGLGHTLLMRGETAAASETLSAAHRLARAEQRWMFQIFAATGMALAGIALHEPDLARNFAEEGLALATRYGFNGFRIPALRVLGKVLAMTAGRADEGHAILTSSIEAAHAAGMRAEVARGHVAMAAVGAPNTAHHLGTAKKLHGELGLSTHFAGIEAALAAGRFPYV